MKILILVSIALLTGTFTSLANAAKPASFVRIDNTIDEEGNSVKQYQVTCSNGESVKMTMDKYGKRWCVSAKEQPRCHRRRSIALRSACNRAVNRSE